MNVFEFLDFLSKSAFETKVDEHATYSLPEELIVSFLQDEKVLFPLPVNIIGEKLVVNLSGFYHFLIVRKGGYDYQETPNGPWLHLREDE